VPVEVGVTVGLSYCFIIGLVGFTVVFMIGVTGRRSLVGDLVGTTVGDLDGTTVRDLVGTTVGDLVGDFVVGTSFGDPVG
jgi:hypothetical protein